MRLLLLFAPLLVAASASAQSGAYFPLDVGSRWVYARSSSATLGQTTGYLAWAVVGDTLVGGEPFALVEAAERDRFYRRTQSARCTARLVSDTPGFVVEGARLRGTADCPHGALPYSELWQAGQDVQPVEIGGTTYTLMVRLFEYYRTGIGSGYATFGEGVGLLSHSFTLTPSHGGGSSGFALTYAEVGGGTFGTEPPPSRPPDAQRFYPLEAGDLWVYRYSAPSAEFWIAREVTGDTTLAGVPYALVEEEWRTLDGQPVSASRCAVRFDEAAGWFEWVPVVGTCAPEEEGYRNEFWGRPLDDEDRMAPNCTFAVDGLTYAAETCFVNGYSAAPQQWYSNIRFATDVGLVSWARNNPSDFPNPGPALMALRYARVAGVTYGTVNPVASEPLPVPSVAFAVAAFPSPMRGAVTLRLTLPSAGPARVEVFSVLGRRVHAVYLGARPAGVSEVALDGSRWAPGVYFVRLTTGDGTVTTARLVRAE